MATERSGGGGAVAAVVAVAVLGVGGVILYLVTRRGGGVPTTVEAAGGGEIEEGGGLSRASIFTGGDLIGTPLRSRSTPSQGDREYVAYGGVTSGGAAGFMGGKTQAASFKFAAAPNLGRVAALEGGRVLSLASRDVARSPLADSGRLNLQVGAALRAPVAARPQHAQSLFLAGAKVPQRPDAVNRATLSSQLNAPLRRPSSAPAPPPVAPAPLQRGFTRR